MSGTAYARHDDVWENARYGQSRCGGGVSNALGYSNGYAGGPLANMQFPVNNGVASAGFYDARTGGRYVGPNNLSYGVYNSAGVYSNNNVAVYQAQLQQTYAVQGYNQGYNNGGYSNGYVNPYSYNGGVTVSPYVNNSYNYNTVAVNPWNNYVGQSYNGYNYNQVQPTCQRPVVIQQPIIVQRPMIMQPQFHHHHEEHSWVSR